VKMLFAFVFAALALPVTAQDAANYPSKPIHIVIPFPPGGATDVITRRIGERMTQKWGQPVVVENKPGANTVIGTQAVHRAPADGYTILMTSPAGLVQLPPLMPSLPYDPERDFMPLTQIAEVPTALVVPVNLPVKSVKQLADYLKANPAKTAYGSLGLGSTLHIYGEAFRRQIGADTVHVPYKGDAPAMTDLFGGRIQYLFNNPVSAIGAAKGGKVRILAVTGEQRSKALPDVPTLKELGINTAADAFFGLYGPAGMAPDLVARIDRAVADALRAPEVQEKIYGFGLVPNHSSAAELASTQAAHLKRWEQPIKASGFKAE
jgi:tripartite-type tricarboxylate transporter receptor subunit TctC